MIFRNFMMGNESGIAEKNEFEYRGMSRLKAIAGVSGPSGIQCTGKKTDDFQSNVQTQRKSKRFRR